MKSALRRVNHVADKARLMEARLGHGHGGSWVTRRWLRPAAQKAGRWLARKGLRRVALSLWMLSSAWGALCMLAMVVLTGPFFMPIGGLGGWLWGRGARHAQHRPIRGSACRLMGGVGSLLAAAGMELVYFASMWLGGMAIAAIVSEACSQALRARPEWAPNGRVATALGLNVFVLVAGVRPITGPLRGRVEAVYSPLPRLAAMGYAGFEEPGFVALAGSPVGLAGALWGVCAPCSPWSTPLGDIEARLKERGGAYPEETRWVEWAKALRDGGEMEAATPAARSQGSGAQRL